MEMVEQKVKHQDKQNWDRHGVYGLMFALTAVRAIFITSPARVSGFAYLLPDSQFLSWPGRQSRRSRCSCVRPVGRHRLLKKVAAVGLEDCTGAQVSSSKACAGGTENWPDRRGSRAGISPEVPAPALLCGAPVASESKDKPDSSGESSRKRTSK